MSIRFIGFGLGAGLLSVLGLLPAPASAAPGLVPMVSAENELVQNVDYYKRRWRKAHRDYDDDDGPAYVRAPFTEVDTHRGTWVSAPFARVYTGRGGTWVRAPFVNLWTPRD